MGWARTAGQHGGEGAHDGEVVRARAGRPRRVLALHQQVPVQVVGHHAVGARARHQEARQPAHAQCDAVSQTMSVVSVIQKATTGSIYVVMLVASVINEATIESEGTFFKYQFTLSCSNRVSSIGSYHV